MRQQGAPEAEPDPLRGPVQAESIGPGQGVDAIEHHQDLPHRRQQGTQQKLGVAGVDVVERRHLAGDGDGLPQGARQRLAIGHSRQHADLAVEGADHLGQRRVDQLGDQDELAVVEHSHLGLGALPRIPLQMGGDHHQGIDVAAAQRPGPLVDGVKLIAQAQSGGAIQRERQLTGERAAIQIHQTHLEIPRQPGREDPAQQPDQQQRDPANQGPAERVLPQQPPFAPHQSSTSTLMPTRNPSTGCKGRASTWKLFMSKPWRVSVARQVAKSPIIATWVTLKRTV
ncbi:hypothetical protein D3C85_974170 [compost metagenome]